MSACPRDPALDTVCVPEEISTLNGTAVAYRRQSLRALAIMLGISVAIVLSGCTYTTRVSGTVQDDKTRPVQAEVVLELEGGGKSPRVLADGNGRFSIERQEFCLLRCFGPAPRLVVRKAGFETYTANLQRFAHVERVITLQSAP